MNQQGKIQESGATQLFRRRQHLVHEGEARDAIFRIHEGWACRYRVLRDGRRQITALFLPGDYCEPQWLLEAKVRQPIIAASNVRVTDLAINGIFSRSSGSEPAQAILSAALDSLNRQAEWIVSLGRKTAIERLSALLCEVFQRMRNAGFTYADQCAMPLTQVDLADVTGLTPVHVNRVLRELRGLRLAELRSGWLRIFDGQELQRIADLDSSLGMPSLA